MKKIIAIRGFAGLLFLTGCNQSSQEPKSRLSLEGFGTHIGYVHPTDVNTNGIVDGFFYMQETTDQKLKYTFLDPLERGVIDHYLVTDNSGGIVKNSIPRDTQDNGDLMHSDVRISWGMANGVYSVVKIRSQQP